MNHDMAWRYWVMVDDFCVSVSGKFALIFFDPNSLIVCERCFKMCLGSLI